MGYTLRAGITTGRIDCDLGSFEIRDRTLECDDYETARLLARSQQYSVSWPDGDPGPPEDESEDVDEAEDGEDDDVDEAEAAVEEESEPVDESDADVEADAEEEVERDDEDREIFTCAGMDGDCTRRVDEPGGLCWQHEDQG